ncbi:T9SS type A sorting domain-containing protein [Polaribacter aestuariivivens]|uniref:T9SS type A sorting domain-containing protein n=1 Tax=Polaribacter aestuariivivens TaxID=2304626 RepID=UPI003F498899
MTKKITPNFLRHVLVLIIFSKSITFFSQNNVNLNVNWPRYSGENKMEILNSSNVVVLSIDDNYGVGSDTSFLNQTSSTVSLPNGSYTIRVYDNYGDDWNGTGPYGKVFVNGTEEFSFDGNFTNNGPANVEIQLDFALDIGLDDASFSYANSSYSISDADPTPTITGENGGSFSGTTGLVINTTTGQIDVSESTIGNHTITYTTTAPDQSSAQQNVNITFATSQYFNSSKKYIEYIPGTMPVIISAPHGGVLNSGKSFGGVFYPDSDSSMSDRNCGVSEQDDNTDVLIREIQKRCYEQFGVYPYIIINNLHRSKLDPNRNKSVATCGNSNAEPYFDAYHGFIDQASADVNSKFGKGLYIDLHGQSHTIPRVEIGYNLVSSSYDENLNNSSTNASELARVTIKNLIENNLQNLTFEDLIRGSQSFGGLLQTTGGSEYAAFGYGGCSRSEGYRAVPSHISSGSSQGSCDDTNPGSNAYFAGDYYSNIRHGSGNTATANTVVEGGGTVNGGGGTIDGIMTEVNRRVRDLGNTLTEYDGRQDTRSGGAGTIPPFSRDYGKVIEKYIDLHYNDFSNFSYAENTHSIYGVDVTPTVTGISGGSFASTTGLSINTTTGAIDVSASTPGTYTISYTAPNVGNYYKKEFQIIINTDEVTNEFTANSGNWSVTSNWSLNREPISTDNVLIPTGKTAHLDGNQKTINNLTVIGNFIIDADKSLTISGNISNTGTFTINSGGSVIVNGTSTGNLIYKRNLDANKWYLIGAPLSNQSVANFALAHPNITRGSGTGNDRNIALAEFDNTKSSQKWSYYKVGQVNGIGGDDTTDQMTSGLGYTTRLTTAGDVSFTGTLQTENVAKTVSQGVNSFNLISNPYPSYINSATFLTENTGTGKSLKTQTLWVWDQSLNGGAGDYDTRITIQNFKIAPGQAFFVEVDDNIDVNFSESSQSHQNTDTFLKENRPEIKLNITDGTNSKFTEIYYIDGSTTGFDDGYDGEIFNGITSSFQIFSGLVSNESDKKLSIQSIPNSNHEAMIIPIGMNAKSGSEVVFSVESKNIPNGLNIYLEDKAKNTFTKLSESSKNYKVILNEDFNGFGNFYLHTKSNVLSTNSENLKTATIFNNDNNELVISGVIANENQIQLFNILGKEVFTTTFSSNGNSKIQLPKLPSGVYFSKLKNNTTEITKKIIIK